MAFADITPTKLGQAAITGAVATLYTVPAATRTMLKDIDICNTGVLSRSVTVYLVPSAGAPATSNALFYQVDLAAKSIFQWSGVQILNVGDTIQVEASAGGCTINASGGECI